tara:strand:+ start:1664 stop:1867 length:204 start_codon:yes stop_codon:yes gene_type:complete
MKEITREEKYETILEWWLEGWLDLKYDMSILTDELTNLHTKAIKPLYEYSDDELDDEYKDIMQRKGA